MAKFEEDHISTFMGGTFQFEGQPKTVGQLRKELKDILKELEGWGDDSQELSECIFWKDGLRVGMASGIVQ